MVRGFFALHGQGHATPASRFLAHEVIVAGWTTDPAVRGLEAALAVLRWDSVVGARTELTTSEARGDTVVLGEMLHRSRFLTGLGVGEVLRLPGSRLVVHDGLIHAIDLAPLDDASRRAYDEAMSAFIPWARHEYRDRLDRIYPDQAFEYDARRAADLLELLEEWRTGVR